jgi:hypothetical protein
MNPTLGLVERDLNAENKMKGKRRAVMSMGGKPVDDTLSPKSLARRTAVCRFSHTSSPITFLSLLCWRYSSIGVRGLG